MKSKKQTEKIRRISKSNRTYKFGDWTVVLPDATSFNPMKACQPLGELVRAEWPSGDNSTLVKKCLGVVDELSKDFWLSHFNSHDQRHCEFVYSQLHRWLVELRKKSTVELPPIPSDIFGVSDWITSVKRALAEAAKKPKHLETETTEYSFALPMTKWADILDISENKLRELRGKIYHFDKVSSRKWRLPKDEIPLEYLQKYRKAEK